MHVVDLEGLTLYYERDPDDPRCAHALTLEVDPFGTVLRSAAVTYPRRAAAIPEQSVPLLTYTEHDVLNVTDQPDWYRLAVPLETRGYELTGVAAGGTVYDPHQLAIDAAAAATIAFEAEPDGTPQKRLCSRTRTRYLADDLQAVLPGNKAARVGITERTYQLVLTPGLRAVFAAQVSAAALDAIGLGAGGYVDLDGDGCWWAPSAQLAYSADSTHPDAAYAAAHFYLPQGLVDPFGAAQHGEMGARPGGGRQHRCGGQFRPGEDQLPDRQTLAGDRRERQSHWHPGRCAGPGDRGSDARQGG